MAKATLATAPQCNQRQLAGMMAAFNAMDAGDEDTGEARFALEAQVLESRARTPGNLLWKLWYLARAIENEWKPEFALAVLRSIEADVMAWRVLAPPKPHEPPIEKLAFTIAEAEASTGISKSVLYEEIAAGRLETRKRGSATLILREELARYLSVLPKASRSSVP